jgi:hypothetical protein
MTTLESGSLVVRRQFQRDDLLSRVWVGRVAAEDEHGLWVWVATGSPYRDIAAVDGRGFREVPFDEWRHTDKTLLELTWNGDMLVYHPRPGDRPRAYSVWFFFHPDGRFRSWYVNLEEPAVWWSDHLGAGVDTVDYDLDLVVAPDRVWRWKDEDEFTQRLAYPHLYWVDDEERVRAEGRRLAELVEAGRFPFDGHGTTFRPDPGWSVPAVLPAGWDRPRVRVPDGRVAVAG